MSGHSWAVFEYGPWVQLVAHLSGFQRILRARCRNCEVLRTQILFGTKVKTAGGFESGLIRVKSSTELFRAFGLEETAAEPPCHPRPASAGYCDQSQQPAPEPAPEPAVESKPKQLGFSFSPRPGRGLSCQ